MSGVDHLKPIVFRKSGILQNIVMVAHDAQPQDIPR
jgi:hypothetical protein